MKFLQLFCLLFVVSFGESIIQLPLTIHNVPMKTLKANHEARMKQGQKLIESMFWNDYITTQIDIGTPKQSFDVVLSTGSSTLWVIDSQYQKVKPTQHTYSSADSSTSKNLSLEFNPVDGSYYVEKGFYFTDDVELFGVKVQNQTFGSIISVADMGNYTVNTFPVDGIVGLSHYVESAYKNGTKPKAFIDNLLKQVAKPIVTVYLEPYSPKATKQSGLVTIGSTDNEHCDYTTKSLPLPLVQVDDGIDYTLKVKSFSYGQELFMEGRFAYLDTAVSRLGVPPPVLYQLTKRVELQYDFDYGIYVYECSKRSDFKDFNIVFEPYNEDYQFTVTPEEYLIDIGMGNGNCALMVARNDGQFTGPSDYALSTVFMRKFCTQFNMKENTVNLYNHK